MMNTHLDDQSDKQRRFGASLILERANRERNRECGGEVWVVGDFNRLVLSFVSPMLLTLGMSVVQRQARIQEHIR